MRRVSRVSRSIQMELAVPPESESRRSSLIEKIASTQVRGRKDSISPFTHLDYDTQSYKSSRDSMCSMEGERTRRLSRKLSLKPPLTGYKERRESQTSKTSDSALYINCNATTGVHHTVVCDCGKEIRFQCRFLSPSSAPSITLSGAEVTELKKAITDKKSDNKETVVSTKLSPQEHHEPLKLQDIIDDIKNNIDNYDLILRRCIDIGKVDDQDSLEVVLSRQNTIKCLVMALKRYTHDIVLQQEACKSLLKQVQHSEVSLHYLSINDGITLLNNTTKSHPESVTLLATVLDIYCYFASQDEWRSHLTEKINQGYFLTTMARHENDAVIVEKCCTIIGNLVLSEDLARSLMYVGGVHSIISMLNKYNTHLGVLRHCCAALGTFASHDDTCQAVAEAGATLEVINVLKSYKTHPEIQESCCWAIASLSRSDGACLDLINYKAVSLLLDVMQSFTDVTNIQEYGCWALCNLVVLGSKIDDNDSKSAVELLIRCMGTFTHNVELQEHICYAINALVTLKPCVHGTFVRSDGINQMVELMKNYEDSEDIQINGSKVIGNLAVHDEFRYYLEDIGSSEVIISCMLKMEKNQSIQLTGCMALTNLSAELADNKYRILKNGGVNAVLQAMKNFMEDVDVQLNALKVLCNLMESDKGCWWIAEESGIQVISMTLKAFSKNQEILNFGCLCLGNLPRRGVNTVALESVKSTLLYLRQRESGSVEIAHGVCMFYENVLKIGTECKKLFNKDSMETVLSILQEFDDTEVLITACRIVALVALGDKMELITKAVTRAILSIMRQYQSDSNIQLICCGAISYLSGSGDGIESLSELDCIEAILDALKMHPDNESVHNVGLIALENVCKAVLRRQSMDTLEPVIGVFKRRSVTEEILEIASSALQRVIKFKEDVMEDSEGSEDTDLSTELSVVVSDCNET